MEAFSWCKDLWTPKTFNRFSFVANVCWIAIGIVLFGVFLDMEINEARFDFRCDVNTAEDFIRGKCFVQYEKRYNKLSIPLYGFVIVNFLLPVIVCVIYSQSVRSRINELEASNAADVEGQIQLGNRTRRKLFTAYCCQLATRFCLGILFIVFLQTQASYPSNFPSDFKCNFLRGDNYTANATGNTQKESYKCHNQRAHKKTSWAYAVKGANGILALVLLTEIFIILSRARKGKKFMEDLQFFADHLKSNFDPPQEQISPQIPLLTQQEQARKGSHEEGNQETSEKPQRQQLWDEHNNTTQQISEQLLQGVQDERNQDSQDSVQQQAFLKNTKDSVLKGTERPRDLASPFRPNPGEGDQPKNLKLDQIYTKVVIYPGRAHYDFTGDRRKQLKVYPKTEANQLPPTRPAGIIDAEHKNILVVGRPGIGKTLFCTKLLRDWASDSVFNEAQNAEVHFDVAFLLKFRRFNSAEHLNLRELLARSEFSTPLNDVAWDYILKNPSKLLLLFDGIDEFSAKTKITKDDSYHGNTAEEKMPLHALYSKIASGKLLHGATVISTTRPTATSYVRYVDFDRTVEILGFSSNQVEDYVEKFTEDDKDAGKTIWQHISSNLNLFSLCYVPVNSFIICSCLLHILKKPASNLAGLPTKLTHIYSFATKLFFFRHSDRYRFQSDSQDMIYESFDNLPDDVKRDFEKLGRNSFKGIEEGRLIFGSDEVENLEDCGLLHRLPDLEAPAQRPFEQPKAQFCFTHLTMQEFLAAKHVTDTINDAELREFVSDHIKDGAWQVVIQFVAGLLSDRGEPLIDIFIDLLPVSTDEKEERELIDDWHEISANSGARKLTCWPADHERDLVVTLCYCLHEIDAKDSVIQNKIREIGFNAVDLSNCSLTPVDCTAIVDSLKYNKDIISINLSSNAIGSLGCKEIQKLFASCNDNESNCKLSSLNLSANNLPDESIKFLVEALKHSNCKLSSLNLSANNLSDESMEFLVEALKHSNCKLSSLNLSYNNITDESMEVLVEALKHSNCKLSSLNLGYNYITDESIKFLVEALKHSNCKLSSLNLGYNNITDESMEFLVEALKHSNCKLSSLNLYHTNITDESIKFLVEALKHSDCKLSSLNLSDNCHITDDSIEFLVEALKHSNCKLSSLNLCYNNITDESMEFLVEALKHSNCKLRV